MHDKHSSVVDLLQLYASAEIWLREMERSLEDSVRRSSVSDYPNPAEVFLAFNLAQLEAFIIGKAADPISRVTRKCKEIFSREVVEGKDIIVVPELLSSVLERDRSRCQEVQ